VIITSWSLPAFAVEWTVTATATADIEPMKSYPDLIQVAVKKDGAAAPDDTKVVIERISGDAQLFDPATSKLDQTVTLKTKGGNASATVFMQKKPRAIFTVKVVDAGNAMLAMTEEPVDLESGSGDLASAPGQPCTEVREDDVEITRGNTKITLEKDERCRTGVWLYTGMVVDSFAAKELNKYFNPNDANDLKTSFVAGIDVEQYVGRNTWLYLETVNGVRSVDVDCGANPTTEVCEGNNATNQQFLFILRNARTLEAFLGARYEFPKGDGNGRFYLKTQAGFLNVAGAGTDIVDNHTFLAAGYLSADERFEDSYVEVGFGKSDIFDSYENRRFKFDGFLTAPLAGSNTAQWFLQMTVDSDFRSGPDSIQIYMGVDFDLRQLSLRF
jgi:hypothetical protein